MNRPSNQSVASGASGGIRVPDIDKTEDEVRQAVLNKMQLEIDRLEEFNGRQRASKPPVRPTKNGLGWLLTRITPTKFQGRGSCGRA